MRFIWNNLFKGLVTVLPVALTLYLIYWLGTSIESMLRPAITTVVPESYYLPGMGLLAGLVLLFFIGLAINAWIVQRLIQMGERFLERIPLVKSIYGALRDFMDYFSAARQHSNQKQVVMVMIADTQVMGFITGEHVDYLPEQSHSEDIVSVYLPMSYQIGGYTIYVPRSKVTPVKISMEDAMRQILTAGLSR